MYRQLTSILILALSAMPSTVAAQSPPVAACPFTPAELSEVLGETFEAGAEDAPLSAGALTLHSCRYKARRYTLRVGTTVYQRPADAATHIQGLAGTKVPIPGDPDGAVFQEGQGDNTAPAVAYLRQGVVVELRIAGGFYDDPSSRAATMRALREKLAKLRRAP